MRWTWSSSLNKKRCLGLILFLILCCVIDVGVAVGSQTKSKGDGYGDLVIGIPRYDGSAASDGGVCCIYGSNGTGLTSKGNQIWDQDKFARQNGQSEDLDYFGSAVTVGDFNGDGYDDIAVGAPGDDISGKTGAGMVGIGYGSLTGIWADYQYFHQDSEGIPGEAEDGDGFGDAVAAGDFNGDGYDDLVIGVPEEELTIENQGYILILRGSPDKLITDGNQFINIDDGDIPGEAFANANFGCAFAAGDFNNDGYDDLAIGVKGQEVDSVPGAGAVVVLNGSADGLLTSTAGSKILTAKYVTGMDLGADLLGASLTSGDFNGDHYDDLAAGAPLRDTASVLNSGAAVVFYGSGSGLTNESGLLIERASPGLEERLGYSLASGDFDRDSFDDLAIGIPWYTDFATHQGAVMILKGTSTGLNTTDTYSFTQQAPSGMEDTPHSEDYFGYSLAAGNLNGDEYDDLAIGVAGEDRVEADLNYYGAVAAVYGTENGLTSDGNQLWWLGNNGIGGSEGVNYRFGSCLAIGDFGNSGSILSYVQSCNGSFENTFSRVFHEYGMEYIEVLNDQNEFQAQLTGSEWTIVFIDDYAESLITATKNAIINYIATGGRCFASFYGWCDISAAAFDADFAQDYDTPIDIYNWRTTHTLFNVPNSVPGLSGGKDLCGKDGSKFNPTAGGIALSGYTQSENANETCMILGNDGRTLLFGGTLGLFDDADADSDGKKDIQELAENIVSHLNLLTEPICETLGVKVIMPDDFYSPGETFWCNVEICSPQDNIENVAFFAALNIGTSDWWFHPTWLKYPPDFDYETIDVNRGRTIKTVLSSFTWPDTGSSTMTGITLLSALVTPELNSLMGEYDMVTFGFGP